MLSSFEDVVPVAHPFSALISPKKQTNRGRRCVIVQRCTSHIHVPFESKEFFKKASMTIGRLPIEPCSGTSSWVLLANATQLRLAHHAGRSRGFIRSHNASFEASDAAAQTVDIICEVVHAVRKAGGET